MKSKVIILSTALLLGATAMAQTGVKTNTPFGRGADSVRCLDNISLFTSDVKNDNLEAALAPWEAVYKECPASTKNIYIHGVKILKFQFDKETDPAKKATLIDRMMELYDNRIKYFGDDPKYGPDMITANRITDYITMVGAENVNYDKIYKWTKDVIDQMREAVNPQMLYYYVNASLNKAIKDASCKETYINDYMFASEALEKKLQSTQDSTQQQVIIDIKNPMDDYFAHSGLADCATLVKLYTPKYEQHKTDVNFLTSMLTMFNVSNCEENPLYVRASRSLFDIKPTAEAAMGLAQEALQAKKYDEAIKFLQQAISLTNNSQRRANANYTIGVVYMNQRNYGQARSFFNRALQDKPNYGLALINIAQMYASSVSSIYQDDKVKQRCIYYLVIDKLEHARQIDSSVAARAGNLIGTYRQYLPSAADIFMHPELDKGKSIHIGGWIGESTTIR